MSHERLQNGIGFPQQKVRLSLVRLNNPQKLCYVSEMMTKRSYTGWGMTSFGVFHMNRAMLTGILASFFFAFTFILNRSMNLSGGFFGWSASLRYIFACVILFACLLVRHEAEPVIRAVKDSPLYWLVWSTVGFGFFYLPLTLGSLFGESWFTAATWQITIVCGILLTPLFHKRIPWKNFLISCLILVGVALLQVRNIHAGGIRQNAFALIPILIAAFCYPLGNRKMMEKTGAELSTLQRVAGMTLCSLPFFVITAVISRIVSGTPSAGQIFQCFLVALFSSVIATILFFHATDLVRNNPGQLAAVEATQCGEVLFTLLLGVLVLHDPVPDPAGILGIFLISAGIVINSFISAKNKIS